MYIFVQFQSGSIESVKEISKLGGQRAISQSLSQYMSLCGFRKQKQHRKKKAVESRWDSEKNSTLKSSRQVKLVYAILETEYVID